MIASTLYGGHGKARDAFLDALDQGDTTQASRLAASLTGCTNPLPSTTCMELRLPIGSTYAEAARTLLEAASRCREG